MDECAPEYARLITQAIEYDAPIFAEDLAFRGMHPESLRVMARRWREVQMEPQRFAWELEDLADKVDATGIVRAYERMGVER